MGQPANLRPIDYRKLLEIIDLVYSASCPDALFSPFFEELRKAVGINSAVYLPVGQKGLEVRARGSIVFDSSPRQAREYAEYYSPLDPFIAKGWFNKPNRVARNTDLFPASKFANSEFAIDFLARVPCFWVIAGSLGSPSHLSGVLGLHRLRHERNFSDHDVAFLSALLPHVSRALNFLAQRNQQPRAGGIVILDDKGAVVYMTEPARRILKGKSPEAIRFPICRPPLYQDTAIFQSDEGDYAVGVQTLLSRYKIVSLDPVIHNSLQSRLGFMGLTPRQQEIASRVLCGLSNKGIASELNLTEQTVKDHINAIFRRVGIHHRAELAARVVPFLLQ